MDSHKINDPRSASILCANCGHHLRFHVIESAICKHPECFHAQYDWDHCPGWELDEEGSEAEYIGTESDELVVKRLVREALESAPTDQLTQHTALVAVAQYFDIDWRNPYE